MTSAAHCLPAQAALDADAGRGALLGLLAPDLQVAELGVGHQPSVDEQRRADSGAERHDQHRSVAPATRAHAHLGKTGGIGVVQKRPPAGGYAKRAAPGHPSRSSVDRCSPPSSPRLAAQPSETRARPDPWTACGSRCPQAGRYGGGGCVRRRGHTQDLIEERAAHRVDARRLYEGAPDVKRQDLRFGGATANSAHHFGRALSPASGFR